MNSIENVDGHEDAYCISKEYSDAAKRDMVKEVHIVVPPSTKVLNMIKENVMVEKDQTLLEFVYEQDLTEYLELTELLGDDDDDEVLSTYGSGDNSIKLLANGGEIIDIKVYINNKGTADTQLINFHEELVNDSKKTIARLAKSATTKDERLKAVDNMNINFFEIGGHKFRQNEFQGVRVVYYIKQQKPLIAGDKIANRYGAKGVIGKVFDETPKGEITPRIDVFISSIGVFSRKNIAMIKEIYLGKIMYFLNEQVIKMANNPKIKTDDIIKHIVDTYKAINVEKITDIIIKNINNLTLTKFRKLVKAGEFRLFFTVEPFTDVSFKDIKLAAEHIEIELDEKVYIPERDEWTQYKVPVGVAYYNALEQFSEIYANVRSTGAYQSLTRQPVKGKSRAGGQSVGQLDMQALLTYEIPSVLNEIFTVRSDAHRAKRMVHNSIITTGSAKLPKKAGRGGTGEILSTYITAMGLQILN